MYILTIRMHRFQYTKKWHILKSLNRKTTQIIIESDIFNDNCTKRDFAHCESLITMQNLNKNRMIDWEYKMCDFLYIFFNWLIVVPYNLFVLKDFPLSFNHSNVVVLRNLSILIFYSITSTRIVSENVCFPFGRLFRFRFDDPWESSWRYLRGDIFSTNCSLYVENELWSDNVTRSDCKRIKK